MSDQSRLRHKSAKRGNTVEHKRSDGWDETYSVKHPAKK